MKKRSSFGRQDSGFGSLASLDCEDPWERVRTSLPRIVEVFQPGAILDSLYSEHLINRAQWERLSEDVNNWKVEQVSRQLLVSILPRTGPTAYSTFLDILETSDQNYLITTFRLREKGKPTAR